MLLSNRIRRRVRATKLADFQAYLRLLQSPDGHSELSSFLDAVTTNETSFFRTEKHFDWLRDEFIDEIRDRVRKGDHPPRLRIWSAACSTGEEPYTIAMCIAENRHKVADWTVEIHGTDISEEALSKARSGIFGPHVVDEVPERFRDRYFQSVKESNQWAANSSLTRMITISRHNLMQPNPERDYDCVFIRNVLIYFSRESKQVVVNHLVESLAKGGYLVVGPSEGIFDMLGMLEKRSPFLYQKP